ncbi:Phage late control gene D protein (GPD) [compost metagenome]
MPKIQDNIVLMEPYFSVTLNGKPLELARSNCIDEIEVEDEVGKHTLFRLYISDPNYLWLNDPGIKKGVPIQLKYGHRKNHKQVSGKIYALEASYPTEGVPKMTIIGLAATYTMSEVKKTRTWKKKKVSDVINAIFKEHGIKAKVESTVKVVDHIVQKNETDYDFVVRKAKENGMTISKSAASVLSKDSKTEIQIGKAKPNTTPDPLYYRKIEGQILSFSPSLQERDVDVEDRSSKSKTKADSTGAASDVKMKDGTVKKGQPGTPKPSPNSGGTVSVDKTTGEVKINSKK